MIPRLALPPSPALLALILVAFALPGLAGHDPWKPFDVVGVEIVHQMHVTGDWLVPRIAGEPWLDDPPLYHWVALAFAKAFGGLLQFHNAARLASGAFFLAAAWFLYRAAGPAAALILAGSTGLIVHAHETVPDLATLAAACAALGLLDRADERPALRGALFGIAVAVAFLSTGVTHAAVLLGVAIAVHAFSPRLRTPGSIAFLAPAFLLGTALSATWPLALWLRAPEALALWWESGVRAQGNLAENLRYFASTAIWFAWPAWPLAAWATWSCRRELSEPGVLAPLLAALGIFTGIVVAGPAQDINHTALLAPLALLGARGIPSLRRGATNALDWFGIMTFGFFAGIVWFGWFAMMTGTPARMANNFTKTTPGFVASFDPIAFAVALAITLLWAALAFRTAPSPTRSVTRWAGGTALLWGVFSMLWIPWADHIKSYRHVALDLKAALSGTRECVAQRHLGVPQLAALSYHGGISAKPFDPSRPTACRLLIVQGGPRDEAGVPGPRWTRMAEAARPGDRHERYRLYRHP